jgi:hypothetical protein
MRGYKISSFFKKIAKIIGTDETSKKLRIISKKLTCWLKSNNLFDTGTKELNSLISELESLKELLSKKHGQNVNPNQINFENVKEIERSLKLIKEEIKYNINSVLNLLIFVYNNEFLNEVLKNGNISVKISSTIGSYAYNNVEIPGLELTVIANGVFKIREIQIAFNTKTNDSSNETQFNIKSHYEETKKLINDCFEKTNAVILNMNKRGEN